MDLSCVFLYNSISIFLNLFQQVQGPKRNIQVDRDMGTKLDKIPCFFAILGTNDHSKTTTL